MKSSFLILPATAITLFLSSCGENKEQVKLEKQLQSSESFVKDLLQQTITNDSNAITADFSEQFTKETYLQWIQSLETEVGEFNNVDLVAAKSNPTEFTADRNADQAQAVIEGDSIRVMAVLLSGEQTGATLNVYLQPRGNSWAVMGLDAETTGGSQPATISQAD